MQVFRISLSKYAELKASGNPARWNSKGKYMLYAAESTALACLENIVHRSSEGLTANFRLLIIEIQSNVFIDELDMSKLSNHWKSFDYIECQALGDNWLASFSSAVLKVPSAIIPHSYNFLINPAHNDFREIKITTIDEFLFDSRLS